jgi:dihydroorotate dehydrogenase
MGWRRAAYRAVRPLLFAIEAEAIHRVTLRMLAVVGGSHPGRSLARFTAGLPSADADPEPIDLLGLRFRNRVGVGAGFDKDGVALRGWAALGLGFAELGTVTPRPQAGNPRPRVFRLPADEALVNRMGFNNDGADALAARLASARAELPAGFVVGINIGPNRDTPDHHIVDDFASVAATVTGTADYLAVNVSSPNTPGLRDLQQPARLAAVLMAVASSAPDRPIVVKLAPDLAPEAFDAIVTSIVDSPARGLIMSNTTVARVGLRSAPTVSAEAGGLSGMPLRAPMLAAVSRARELTGRRMAIVASGGIGSAADAVAALTAGADLVQLWTGLVYAGPGLIGDAVRATR